MSRLFTIVECDQRTAAWHLARVGRLTGSVAGNVLAKLKEGGEPAVRRDLRTRLAVERITGQPCEDDYMNDAMRWGVDTEASARSAYEAVTGNIVRQTGFLAHVDTMAGTSLDGDVNDFEGVIEIKCPKMATHLSHLERPTQVPSQNVAQMVHALWITGAQWCDFVSFDPRFPPELQLLIVRMPRDEKAISAYELAATLFLSEVDRRVEDVRALMTSTVAA